MKRGEEVRCTVEYDLLGLVIKGEKGCYVKTDESTGKHLIWFPCNGEWAELEDSQIELVNKPGYIPKKFKKFIKNIKTLEYTFPT